MQRQKRFKGHGKETGNDSGCKRTRRTFADTEGVDHIAQSKRDIRYCCHKGKFLKKCPGTPGYLCCNYYVLNLQTNCNYNCQYCIMQGYINTGTIDIYQNIDTALLEVESFLKNNPDKLYRIGTGELTDSLSLDSLTNTSNILVPFFLKQKNALLELKTKSCNIKNLERHSPEGRIVVSWSINPENIIDEYEDGAADLSKRLESARKCSLSGYKIGIHLDPVILYVGWEDDYKRLISIIFKYLNPKDIIWISIAGFRYTPSLKNIITKRFPMTELFLGETTLCGDGKYRYIRPIRVDAYRKIIGWINQYKKDMPIYFCMENETVWRDVFGKLPQNISALKTIFDSIGKYKTSLYY